MLPAAVVHLWQNGSTLKDDALKYTSERWHSWNYIRDFVHFPQTKFVEKVCRKLNSTIPKSLSKIFRNSTNFFDKLNFSTNLVCRIFFPQTKFVENAKVCSLRRFVELHARPWRTWLPWKLRPWNQTQPLFRMLGLEFTFRRRVLLTIVAKRISSGRCAWGICCWLNVGTRKCGLFHTRTSRRYGRTSKCAIFWRRIRILRVHLQNNNSS